MRTATDLQDAFALFEEQADAYAARQAAARAGTADGATAGDDTATSSTTDAPVLALVAPGRIRHPRRTVIVAGVAAAAVVAAGAIGVANWRNSGGPAPAGSHPVPQRAAPRTYPVTLDPRTGLRLLEVSTSGDATTLDYYDKQTHAQVTVTPRSAHQRLTPGLTVVDLGSLGHGYWTDGSRPMFVQPPSDPATGGPGPTPTPPDTRYAPAVVWEYAPGAFVDVLLQGSRGTKAQLVRLAAALRLQKAGRPVPSALTLRSAPDGMRLVALDSTLHAAGDTAPFSLTGRDWSTSAQYRPARGGDGFAIEATSYAVTAGPPQGSRPLTVDGHRAYWTQKTRELDVDLGGGRYLTISGASDTADPAPSITRDEVVAVARTASVTTHPHDPGRWFPATRALP